MKEQYSSTDESKKQEPVFSREMFNSDKRVQLPENNEELFRNFDKYVPKDFKQFLNGHGREGIKKLLEKELYGATMDEVKKYFEDNVAKTPFYFKKDNDKDVGLLNDFKSGSLEEPLKKLEGELFKLAPVSDDENIIQLRNYTSRLYTEINHGKPRKNMEQFDSEIFGDEMKKIYANFSNSEETLTDLENAMNAMKSGNFSLAIKEIEGNIGNIHSLIEEINTQKDSTLKKISQDILVKTYGSDYLEKLNLLRDYKEYLVRAARTESKKENPERNANFGGNDSKKIEKEKGMEGEELFKSQVENNSYKEAKSLKEDLILFLDSLEKENVSLPNLKDELDEVMYRLGITPPNGAITFKNQDEKRIIEPLLKLKQELNTVQSSKIDNYRSRISEYLNTTFGLEEYKPKEGEKLNSKEQRAVSTTKTDNEYLDYLVKKVRRPGFRINASTWNYYQKYYQETKDKNRQELTRIKSKVSQAEFDKKYEEFQKWEKNHSFNKQARHAEVEIYRHE